ncbi:RNA dependent RNA polymerase-domain-containing protein [Astrocystis sublimbata]|nr:RNA dependent RNA polymerase-domain-containing protein [Astrocystis sublimbata]
MLANNATRRLVGVWQRTFPVSATVKRLSNGRAISTVSSVQSSRWTGASVFALAASAGAVGFGLASFVLDGSPKRTASLYDDKAAGPKTYASVKEMEQALKDIEKELRAIGGDDDIISIDTDDLRAHGYSEWSTVNPDGLPVAVAYPRSTEQVQVIARICHKYRIPIIGYSGGSSLEGHFSAPYGGISVDFAYMNKIIKLNKDDMDVVVQPSIGWQDLNTQLNQLESGLFFPVDPGPSAKIGGMIGTNCSGTNAVKYGTMKDWVINLTVVLADGTVIKTRRRPRKSSAGYNLNSIFVGSEGTLGLVTEATLKLAIVPEETSVAVVTFPTIRDAAAAAAGIMQAGIPIGAIEVMDDVQMKVINLSGSTAPRVWKEEPTLFLKFAGTKPSVVDNIDRSKRITKANGGGNFEFASDEHEQKTLWSARKEALWSMLALRKGDEDVWSTDVAVPFSRLAELIEISKKEMDEMGLFASILGHIGDGNFHESIMYDKTNPAEREKVEKCVYNMVNRALDMEGTCTGEHSIGWGKKKSLLREVGPETVAVMKQIKAGLDPLWILNPGKIFDIIPRVFCSTDATYLPPASHQSTQVSLSNHPPPSCSSVIMNGFGIRPDWQYWDDLAISIFPLPPPLATTLQLNMYFQRFGNVTYIEIGELWKDYAIVRFSPPPSKACWNDNVTVVINGQKYNTRISLLSRRFPNPVPTPGGHSYPPQMKLQPLSLQFGILSQPDEYMPMRTISNKFQGDFSFVVDLGARLKKVDIVFSCIVEDPRWANPKLKHASPIGERDHVSMYKVQIRFPQLTSLLVLDDDDATFSVVIPLQSPPIFFKKGETEPSHSDERSSWAEFETWNRTVDVVYDTTWLKRENVTLRRENQFVDIGRWTTYKLTFAKSKSNASIWATMTRALQDFNIKVRQIGADQLKTSRPTESKFWEILEPNQLGGNLALLAAVEKINLPFDVRYQLEVCISQGRFDEINLGEEFLSKLTELSDAREKSRNRATDILSYVAESGGPGTADEQELFRGRFYDPMALFTDKKALRHYPELGIPTHCVWVRKVVVTPSMIYLSTPAPEASNRVLRHFAQYSDRFIRVQFTDEISRQQDALYNRIAGRHYKFLAFGNSQFRENGAYFFSPVDGIDCDYIRKWMGDVAHIRVVAKYAARLGQCFSTTRALTDSPISQSVHVIEDVSRNGWCFSDGVGKISPRLAEVVTKQHKIAKRLIPSAFQFRLGGSKGLLVVWPELNFNQVCLRPSQKKFEAKSAYLEIIKPSRFSAATLNRQTITILSCLGRTQLANYDKAMDDPSTAMRLLSMFVDSNGITTMMAQMISDGFMRAKEPFFMCMLQARIVVEQGAFVFGCIDETSTLRGYEASEHPDKPNTSVPSSSELKLPQIFLQVPRPCTSSDDPDNYMTVTGLCIVGRNPSLHPGDIRVVEAIDVPALHHLRNVVVFPAKGDRDIPSMCSGGDLDGDDFFVLWDQELIPPERNHPPMIHEPTQPVSLARDVRPSDLVSFFVTYMKNDSLSTIAHAHLAQSDRLMNQGGPKHPISVELAHLHSNAVDYPKSGQPAYLKASLRPRSYPHFMEKPGKSYHSGTVLGRLYDVVKKVEFHPNYNGAFDERILRRFELPDDMLRKARIIKRQHDRALRKIMNQREIGTEFEIWSTFVLTKPVVGSDYQMQETMGPIVSNHRERFRNACIRVAGSREPEVLYPFIAATYRVAWEAVQIVVREGRGEIDITADQDVPFISFPWVFEQELEVEDDEAEYERLLGIGIFASTLEDVEGADLPHVQEEEEEGEEEVILEEAETGMDELENLI